METFDREAMMGMMKGNMAMMIPQTLIMSWINAFFAGFVIRMSFLLLSWHVARRLIMGGSETTVPSDDSLQVDVAVWSCDKGS